LQAGTQTGRVRKLADKGSYLAWAVAKSKCNVLGIIVSEWLLLQESQAKNIKVNGKSNIRGAYLSKERLNLFSEFLDFLENLGKIKSPRTTRSNCQTTSCRQKQPTVFEAITILLRTF
jgi:hypothetical protein